MMSKISVNKRKKKMLNDLFKNFTKLAQQTEIQLGRPRSSRTHENNKIVIFVQQGDRPVAQRILLVILLKEDIPNDTVRTKTDIYCLLQPVTLRSYRCCLQTIIHIYLFVSVFSSNSLSKISNFIVFHIRIKILIHAVCLLCFCSKT